MSRNIISWSRNFLTMALLAVMATGFVASRAAAVEIDMDTYAAVAYSTSSGSYGYAWNYSTQAEAQRVALSRCKAGDAEIVGWTQGGWLVLVVGDNNGYGVAWQFGDGADSNVPLRRALKNCLQHSQKIKSVIRICSGDLEPVVATYSPAIDPSTIHPENEHPLPESHPEGHNDGGSLPAGSIGPTAK